MYRHARGFTLIELSVVLLITGLLLAVAIPGLTRLYDRVQFKSRLTELLQGVSALPRIAYALGEEGSLDELVQRHMQLPHGWTLSGGEDIYIRSSGICSGGTLHIITPSVEREVSLAPPFCVQESTQ